MANRKRNKPPESLGATVNRMLPPSENATRPPPENAGQPPPHWSTCPKCGASRLSTDKEHPRCSATGDRIPVGDGFGRINYMRCANCADDKTGLPTRFQAIRPD